MADTLTFTDLLDRALPEIDKFPKAKKQVIGEALATYKMAKTLELEAMNALLDALRHEYQFWIVEGWTKNTRAGTKERRVLPATSGPDAEKRARTYGFTRIFHISPLESTDGPQD